MKKTEGLIAAPFLPLDKAGEPNYKRIPEYYNFLKKNGIVGAFINGSTGEGVSLSSAEKMKVVEEWKKASVEGEVKLINLVGGTSYKECQDLAIHSEECGLDAVALLAPYYFKPANAASLAEFCARVAESVPAMPFYFYHIPVLTGCNVSMYEFLKVASPMIPNLAGIKYTNEDFMDFLNCLTFENGKYDMLWGRDENLLAALALGARGGVGSTYNYSAPLYYRLIEAFDRGDMDEARKLQQKSVDMIMLLGKYGGISTGKAFMRLVGLDCGEFRLPVKNNWVSKYTEFSEDVRKLEMEDLFSKI